MQFYDINKSSLYNVSSVVHVQRTYTVLDRKLYTARKVDMVAYMYKRLKTMENWERWGVQKVPDEAGFYWEKNCVLNRYLVA